MPQFDTIAERIVHAELNSTLFQLSPLLAIITGRARSQSRLGRPGVMSRLRREGRMRSVREKIDGSTYALIRFHKQKQGGAANVTRATTTTSPAGGQTPSVTNQDIISNYKIGWANKLVPIEIPAADMKVNRGRFANGDIVKDYSESAAEDTHDEVASELYDGFPTSQEVDEDMWDAMIGLKYQLYDGTTTTSDHVPADHKFLGGKDRSLAANAQLRPAVFDATPRQFSFSLIDQINKGGASKKGRGVNLAIVHTDLFFDKVKPQARTEGAQIVENGRLGQFGLIGFQNEGVQYHNTFVTHDPFCPAGSEGGTSYLFGLTVEDFTWEVHSDGDFKVHPLNWLGKEHGKQNVWQSYVEVMSRWYTRKPQRSGVYTDVS